MSLRNNTLATKILVGTSLAVLLTTFITSLYFFNEQKSSLEKAFDKQSQAIASTIAVFSIEPLLTMDYPVLEHALIVAGKANDSILFIEVMHLGKIVAKYGASESSGRKFSTEIRIHDGDSGKLGEVHIVFSTKDHEALIHQRLFDSTIATLLIFTSFGIALAWLLRRAVINPVRRLTHYTEETISQALPELPAKPGNETPDADEIQQLDQRFITMLDGLKRRESERNAAQNALIEHKNNLESIVQQRTKDLAAAQQEATRLNKNKSVFLAAASHDLRQPIQAISLFQSVLANSTLNEDQASANSNIGIALTSLHEILNTLLDVSKLDAGAVIAEPRLFSAELLFARIDDAFGAISEEKGLRFKLCFPIRDITLNTDPNLLFVLLRNLIDNAIKYTPTGGVLVGIRRRGDGALIQVWDTGIGIPAVNQQSIFDEYVQLANPERDKGKGLGLGLSIVQRLANLLGTEVHVRSLKDKGSVFELTINKIGD